MTVAGWLMTALCWTLVIGFNVYLVAKTLRVPHNYDDDKPAF